MHFAVSHTSLLWGVACLVLGCGCNRTEEPAAPTNIEVAATPTATATSAAPARELCTVPFGEPAPVAGKAERCPADPSGNLELPRGKIVFTDAPGAPQVEVELARDEAARERGLMYRTSMPDDHGMLFSWDSESPRTFWMRNTCIPLDMLYVDKDGVIAGILEQVPTLNDAPRGIRCPVEHVLELNAGYARAHGLAPGMKLKIEG
jgi:uncharacterized membrane protein (UPF0127 family)